jgi:hypothetical protein
LAGPVPPLAAGGQGDPFGAAFAVPELPVEGDDPDPDVFGVEFPAPGIVPHGDPLGVVPGAVVLFGFTVAGRVLLPAVGGLVEFEPGIAEGDVEPVGGAAVLPVGGAVVLPVGGAVVVLVGGADCDCPAVLPALPAAVPPAACCATTHVVQPSTTEKRSPNFLIDIAKLPPRNFVSLPFAGKVASPKTPF